MKITREGFAIIETDTHIGKWVEESGRLDHDQNMLPFILPLLKIGDIIIDAGANIGSHTIAYARAVGETGKVLAFEPNPRAYECLLYNMNPFPWVSCFLSGLGDSMAWHSVNQHENAGMAWLNSASSGKDVVITNTIDRIIFQNDYKRLNYIKIDCEGFEVEILEGGKDAIEKYKPLMLIEINRGALARRGFDESVIFKLLTLWGYAYSNVYPGQPMAGEQYDILCIPPQVSSAFVPLPQNQSHENISSQET